MSSGFESLQSALSRFPQAVIENHVDADTPVFVKQGSVPAVVAEAAGLKELGRTKAIRIAKVIAVGDGVLIVEAIETGRRPQGFFEDFGHKLADLHRASAAERFGFGHDNFIGATPQPNAWAGDWVAFWARQRLGFQLKLAGENGLGGNELQSLGAKLIDRLGKLIGGSGERPVLIHGDLWSGNWLCDSSGEPALIDPAVYFANREAEFGMTTWLGQLPEPFYNAYNESWPMEDGWRQRVWVYRLYHALNHLNLFGHSWLAECLAIMKRLA